VERFWLQAQVMPHAAAMVGHGGFGTTVQALAAGIPVVVVPLFVDQPHNARRVHDAGVGLALEDGPAGIAGAVPGRAH
jgi:UDP:flavonoid glycosyltransferase YjiC (YdhE family)